VRFTDEELRRHISTVQLGVNQSHGNTAPPLTKRVRPTG
jgi:hypothetical protein